MNERVVSRRREFAFPINITLEPDRNTGSLQSSAQNRSISGTTRDISTSGIAFVVSAIRIHEAYLVGEGRLLNVEISLPSGKLKMQMRGERYKQVNNQHLSISEYLIGASIVNISAGDRAKYDEVLKGDRRRAGSLEFGIDKSKA